MKRLMFYALTLVVLLGLIVTGCVPAPVPTQAPQPAAEETKEEQPPPSAEPVKIDFWFAMSGRNGEVIQELVDRFNSSQNEVFVTAT